MPEFRRDPDREPPDNWIVEDGAPLVHEDSRDVAGQTYRVRRYRPRIEGLFRASNATGPAKHTQRLFLALDLEGQRHQLVRQGADSRIADPADTTRIFSWLILRDDDKVTSSSNLPGRGYAPSGSQAGQRTQSRSHRQPLPEIRQVRK